MNLRLKWYFFHIGLTFKKVIARLETTQKEKWFFSGSSPKSYPSAPFRTLTRNGQLKEYAKLFEKKVRVMVEEVGGGSGGGLGMFFLQSWFEGGRSKISTVAPGAVTRGGRLLRN